MKSATKYPWGTKLSVFLAVSLLTTIILSAPTLAQERDAMLQFQLSDQLKKSAADWNKGDLDSFLSDYLHSDEMTFTSGGRILKGFDAMEQRYKKAYGNSTDTMGQLSFSDLEVWRLGPQHALVLGRWTLERKEAERRDEGVFTLVMVKVNDHWKILHDHTSTSK